MLTTIVAVLFTSTVVALQAAPQVQFITRQPPARAAVSMVELPFKLDLPFKKDDTTELAAAAHDVIIVGAGAAGVGCAMMLTKTFGLDPSRVLLIERGEGVGDSFRRWPAEMRFISPSFNQQGWTASMDLNSIAHGTSPAFLMHTEHPSGNDYADYLTVCAGAHDLRVRTSTEVVSIEPKGKRGGPPLFSVKTQPSKPGSQGDSQIETLGARYVVWAAGEFQYPAERSDTVAGAELCIHNSRVKSWARLPGDDFVIIGGCVALRLSLTSHTMVPLTPLFTRSSAIPCPRDHPVHSPCTSRLVPRTKGTRAELTRRLIWPRLASGAPCSRRPPLGTPGPWTHPPSWHPTRPHGCAR